VVGLSQPYGRLAARTIHGYLGGIEAGRSEVEEAGGGGSATVEDCARSDEALRWQDDWQTDWRKETGNVCGCESEDFEGNKSAVGKV